MLDIFLLSLPVFLLLGAGVIIVRRYPSSEAGEGLVLKLLVNFFLPCFILHHVTGVEGMDSPSRLLLLVAVGFSCTVGQILLSVKLASWLGIAKSGEGGRTFAVSTGMLNYGYLAIPLVQGLFGSGSVLATLLVHNVGFDLAIWGVVVGLYGQGFSWKRLLNMPLFALIAALALNMSGVGSQIPQWLSKFWELGGSPAIPLGLVMAGMSIGHPDIGFQFKQIFTRWRISLGSALLRLGLYPLALFGLCLLCLHWGDQELAAVLGVHAAMPAAAFPVVLARHFGGHPSIATQVCVLSTLLCLLSTPLWLSFILSYLS